MFEIDHTFGAVLIAGIAGLCGVLTAYMRSTHQKLDTIHLLVNSNLSEVKANLSVANLAIENLRAELWQARLDLTTLRDARKANLEVVR